MKLTLLKLIWKEQKAAWRKISMAAISAGALQALIVVIINAAASNIQAGRLNIRYFLLFALTIAGYSFTSKYAQHQTVILMENLIIGVYVKIAEKVRNCRLLDYENIGSDEIQKTMNTNTNILLEAAKSLTSFIVGLVMLSLSALYIGLLSIKAFIFVLIAILLGMYIYIDKYKQIQKLMVRASEVENTFFKYFREALGGFVELKLNRKKADDLYDQYLKKSSSEIVDLTTEYEDRIVSNNVFVQSFYYTLIAAVIFILPQISSLPVATILQITAVVLFAFGSLSRVVTSIPLIMKSDQAMDRLLDLENRLDEAGENLATTSDPARKFKAINLNQVQFRYSIDDPRGFELGPLSLTVNQGEVLFITGGNGSGKTTLLKVIAGLYQPLAGSLEIDGVRVPDDKLTGYREHFSSIFREYHLFEKFYGQPSLDREVLFELLERFGLAGRTSFVDDRFTNLKLSAGQKKRLALACSYMEDKPVFLFDEIAADLDAEFREFFYGVFLAELKKQGKTIIAVSHDDRYFHFADRLLKLELGQLPRS